MMTGDSSDRDRNEELYSGWNLKSDLNDLVQLVEPIPRADRPGKLESEVKGSDERGGSLLAGKELVSRAGRSSATLSKPPGLPPKSPQVSRIPVSAKARPGRGRGWFIGIAVSLCVVLILVAFAWIVMTSSDYTDVPTFEGELSDQAILSVSPGETVPAFTGLLLVEDNNRWGDTFSDQDLIGKNTVLFVWGSWNENLLAWSQELNYHRLVDLESADVQFVGLNLDVSREAAMAAMNEDLAAWPHIFDKDDFQEEALRPMNVLGIQSSPLILLIDATGRLRAKGLVPDEVSEAYRELFE